MAQPARLPRVVDRPAAAYNTPMCGRFTLRTPARDVARAFGVAPEPDWPPRYNVAPTQSVPAVRQLPGEPRQLVFLQWGLIPSWADDPSIGNRLINARAETLASKAAFRGALRQRRCLIPCDGFYEWQKQGRLKQPYYLTVAGGGLFALAGLWEHWEHGELAIESFTIVTTEANSLLAPLHDRMPVILPPAAYDLWLDPSEQDVQRLQPLLSPYPAEAMSCRAVSPLVNSPRNDNPACLEGKTQQTFGW